jgi:hypothetical protein
LSETPANDAGEIVATVVRMLTAYQTRIADCSSKEIVFNLSSPYHMSATAWQQGGIAQHERTQVLARRLCNALDSLSESDLLSLDANAVTDLSWTLGPAANRDSDFFHAPLATSVLNTLAYVGDERVLRIVETLTGDAWAVKDYEKRMWQAARKCRDMIKSRMEHERERSTLLRPADSCSCDETSLLRPASGNSTHAVEHLLRSAGPGEKR